MYDPNQLTDEEWNDKAHAIHEAGHVVVAHHFNMRVSQADITKRPNTAFPGGMTVIAGNGRDNPKYVCAIATAGAAALRVLLGLDDMPSGIDLRHAKRQARLALIGDGYKKPTPGQIQAFVNLSGVVAEEILRGRVDELTRVHFELLMAARAGDN